MQTYTVLKRGKKLANTTFDSYEKARQFVRKHIRKVLGRDDYNKRALFRWDNVSKGPTQFTTLGYQIKKVA
jgi:hypothetical protein